MTLDLYDVSDKECDKIADAITKIVKNKVFRLYNNTFQILSCRDKNEPVEYFEHSRYCK